MNGREVQDLETRLRKLAKGHDVRQAHYFHGPVEVREDGLRMSLTDSANFCGSCVDAIASVLNAAGSRDEPGETPASTLDDYPVFDTPRSCDLCSAALDYSLTDDGVEMELEHFLANPPSVPLRPADAFALAAMLENFSFFVPEYGLDAAVSPDHLAFLEDLRERVARSEQAKEPAPA